MSILDEKDKNTLEAPEESTAKELTNKSVDSSEELTSEVSNTVKEFDPEEPEIIETTNESLLETLTLEDLELDVSEPSMSFTATLHFEFSDIFNAIEHIETSPEESALETEAEPGAETELESVSEESEPETEPESELVPEAEASDTESELETTFEETALETEMETETEPEPETESQPENAEHMPEAEDSASSSEMPETEEPTLSSDTPETNEQKDLVIPDLEDPNPSADGESEPERKALFSGHKEHVTSTKKLAGIVAILFIIIAASVAAGLIAANSLVDNANAANEKKIAEMQANIKEVDLQNSLYKMAANKVVDDVAVPTYTLDELYALDLREPTGFTANDLKMITRKGLVGCEEAFVKAEQTYGVNSIFLMSIASLESAYGTMMFRPNNMFGYGRTGFSSKQEGIMTVAKGLGTRYLPPGGSLYGGSPTLKGVNKRYAANPQWYYKVGKYMQGYYAELAAEKNGALDKFE